MIETLLPLVRTWMVSLYAVSFQIAVLVALVMVASFLLRRSSPSVRYGLWCIVLVRLCIPAELTLPRSLTGAPGHLPPPQWRASESGSSLTPEERWRARRQAIARTRHNLNLAGLAWGTVFLGLTGYVGWRALQLRRRVRGLPRLTGPEFEALLRECCADMGLRRRIEVRYAPDSECTAPAVTSLLTPVVILPETMARTWEPADLKPILMHELAHVRRFDVVINWLQIALQIVYFFHPLVWLANWKIRSLREEAADDLSVASLAGGRTRYSSSLLRAVELAAAPRPLCGAVGLHERRSDLVKRLRRLLTDGYRPCGERPAVSALKIAVIGGLCLAVSGLVPAHTPFGPPRALKRVAAGPAWDCRREAAGRCDEKKREGARRPDDRPRPEAFGRGIPQPEGRKCASLRRALEGRPGCKGRKGDCKPFPGRRCEVL